MKSNSTALLCFAITLLLGIFLLIPKYEKEYKKAEGFIQGTTYHITYEYKKKDDLRPEIEKILHDFDMSLSTYVPNSIISRINRNDSTVEADDWFVEVFKKSVEVNKITDGAFDITVGQIINALGFGSTAGKDIDS
jgi:thiamine biosynthesis lipoprotein